MDNKKLCLWRAVLRCMWGAYAPDCVNLYPATLSVFPSGHVPGTHVDILQM